MEKQTWYQKDSESVFNLLHTSKGGLSSDEANSRLSYYGLNKLPEKKSDSLLTIFLRQINNPLIYVLIASSLLAIILGKVTDGIVVMSVVIINALIGFIQEYRSNIAIAALKQMVPDTSSVFRDGNRVTLESKFLVPGDIIYFESGDMIPADIRLFEARNCNINESALTGESLPVNKTVIPISDDVALAERKNMAFSGTLILTGTAKGIVVTTGSETELGKINIMLTETKKIETPLTRSIASVAGSLTVVILSVTALLFAIALIRGYSFADAVLASVTLAVAAIPEGIPAIITIALAIGVRQMASRKAVIRHLPAVETLGSTTVICSDKTGTITRNEMTVVQLWTEECEALLIHDGFRINREGSHEHTDVLSETSLRELLVTGVLCNDAHLVIKENGWKTEGDPTEGALLVSARKAGLDSEKLNQEFGRIDVIPFESEHKFMATLNQTGLHNTIFLKGAPEVILERCSLTENERSVIDDHISTYALDGKRILAFAKKTADDHHTALHLNTIGDTFIFIGLQLMIDPPRDEVKAAIALCHKAGIAIKMITGDHKITAAAIGREINIPSDNALTGTQIDSMTPDELKASVKSINIFARVAPENKLSLVRALQSNGEVVAMTGDGVNDAPALRRADIGVAMGITGTDVSRGAADIILIDDNFATIVAAVEEGRRVYDNLLKSLAFVLPTNLGEALILLVSVALFPFANGIPLLPMSPVQILWINLVATVSLALPLAFEKKEPNIMQRPPRDPKESLLNRFVILRTVLVSLIITLVGIILFLHTYNREIAHGFGHSVAITKSQTMTVTSIIFLQIFYLFNCRSLKRSLFELGFFSNIPVLTGVAILIILQVSFVYVPFMNTLFDSSPLDFRSWLVSILAGVVILPIISFEKWVRNRGK